jgi:hypothetical protein
MRPRHVTRQEGADVSAQPGTHDEVELQPVAHRIVATWPPGTFVENLVPFLNGFTPAREGFAYCVDSLLGAVFEIDLGRAAARVVLRHELLGKISAEPMMPGSTASRSATTPCG